jgi:hypothetical protein
MMVFKKINIFGEWEKTEIVMKKLFLLLLLFFVIFNAFTQNFTFQWINDMSLYLGRYTRDIPDV